MNSRILWIAVPTLVLGAAIALHSHRPDAADGADTDERSPRAISDDVRQDDRDGVGHGDAASAAAVEERVRNTAPTRVAEAEKPANERGSEQTSASELIAELGFEGLEAPPSPRFQRELREFAAESRDPAWSGDVEGRLLSEISESNIALVNWHVECRTSKCIVALVYPGGTDLNATAREVQRFAYDLDLLSGPASLHIDTAGTLVMWLNLHRRCGPDWKCLD